jgi:hypothetical protein
LDQASRIADQALEEASRLVDRRLIRPACRAASEYLIAPSKFANHRRGAPSAARSAWLQVRSSSVALIRPRTDTGEVPRQQFMDPIDRMIGDPMQNLAQAILGIEHVQLCRSCRRMDRRGSLTAGVGSTEQPVLPLRGR